MKKLFLFLALLLGAYSLKAQSLQVPYNTQFTFWGGYSFNSIKFLGKTPDSQTSIFGLGIKKPLRRYEKETMLFYTADIIPHVEYHYPKRDDENRRTISTGWGVSPVGFQLIKTKGHTFHPYIQATGGMLLMNQTFPTDEARRLNFTFDLTLGTEVSVLGRNTLTLGYKFHHISNAQTGRENPGLDSNFLFISLLF